MTVLVTGGAGYIGSHCAYALRDRGRDVVVLDDLSRSNEHHIPRGVHFELGDVGDPQCVSRIIREYDIRTIMHFAGFIKVEESVANPDLYFENNTKKSRVLMGVARVEGVKTFVFSSSAAVYGNPSVVPVAESAPLRPVNPYGETKAKSEKDLREIYHGERMRHAILRYFNVAGADQNGRCGYVLEDNPSHLIRAALAVVRGTKDHLDIFGTDYPTPDGTCIRDYIHVVDLVDAHLKALEYLEKKGESVTLNCGYGHGASVLNVIDAVKRVTGKEIPTEIANRRDGDPASLVADSSLIKRVLGWEPRLDNLDTIIEDQFRWERSQQN